MKKCIKCKEEKELDNFRKNGIRGGVQRYKSQCKACMSSNGIGEIEYPILEYKECSQCGNTLKVKEFPKNGLSVKGLQKYKAKCSNCFYKTDRRVGRLKIYGECPNCSNEIKSKNNIYCSRSCHKTFEYKERIRKWKLKEIKGHSGKANSISPWLRRYLLEGSNNKCSKCSFEGYNELDGNSILEIDHINGDSSNSFEYNVRVLCPNCHAMTPTFRARNKNSSRIR